MKLASGLPVVDTYLSSPPPLPHISASPMGKPYFHHGDRKLSHPNTSSPKVGSHAPTASRDRTQPVSTCF
ncbi:hypothetical protein [[Phormidium] sp. ETS-05]|uniref:hypothetical protein n=1 Tax=[Phormidium] sp. ETS-05 TaxID=222819 RepID=UPI0018EF2CF4|nr:hypothetical protein [[Phormidium] sp. ETS-05]